MLMDLMTNPARETGSSIHAPRIEAAPASETEPSFELLAELYVTQTRLMNELAALDRRHKRTMRQAEADGTVTVLVEAVLARIDARRRDVLAGLRVNRAAADRYCSKLVG